MSAGGRTSSDHCQARTDAGGFDYGLAPAGVRPKIQQAANAVREQLRAANPDAAAIGRELRTVKRLLAHGTFVAWLEAEFSIDHAAAVRFIAAAEGGERR
jgi:hypothetical protein